MADMYTSALVLAVLFGISASALAQRGPPVICVNGDKQIDCSNTPKRPRSSAQVQVVVKEHYSCMVDAKDVPCVEVGQYIRNAHPTDDPTVKFCGAPTLDFSEVSLVLNSISEENLPVEFGCARATT